jgi:hypothetical protein
VRISGQVDWQNSDFSFRHYLAVRKLRMSGADVARRMSIDRSSVSRAMGRVQTDPVLKKMSNALLYHLHPEG